MYFIYFVINFREIKYSMISIAVLFMPIRTKSKCRWNCTWRRNMSLIHSESTLSHTISCWEEHGFPRLLIDLNAINFTLMMMMILTEFGISSFLCYLVSVINMQYDRILIVFSFCVWVCTRILCFVWKMFINWNLIVYI